MKKQDSLAVIIPNYNKARYIRQCVESVLTQTLLPDEILIIDDCSTDASKEIIKELCRESTLIKPVFLEKNGGVSHARNMGLKYAKSDYVTFIDADDFYANTDKLKNEMALVKSHSEDIVAYSKIQQVNEDGTKRNIVLPGKNGYLEGNIYAKMLVGDFSFTTIARDYCIKKNILLEVDGYDEKKSLYEDLELIIKIARNYSFYCTYEFGTAYRQVEDGLSKEKKEQHIKVRKQIFEDNVKQHGRVLRVWYYFRWYCNRMEQKMPKCYWKFKDLIILIRRKE